jgi:putative membrane protein
MAEPAVDPNRQAVERADAVLRATMEPVIDDPTVFVKGAALGTLTAIELAKLALSRSQDAAVRTFAEALRRNQEALRKELTAIAGRKRLDVTGSLIYQDEAMLEEGASRSGTPFDAWFVLQANDELLESVALFEAATKMKDRELAAFAKKSLPVLEGDRKALTPLVR